VPQYPKGEQQAPYRVPEQVMPLPQLPSVLGPRVLAGRVVMTLLVGSTMIVGVICMTDRVVGWAVVRIVGWAVVRVVGNGTVVRVEIEVRLETVVRIETLVRVEDVVMGLVREVGTMTEPAGPLRYQFATGSPRHSPTVTAR